MSYQALARKWRPRTFAELSGQEHVVRALTNALARNRLHHAYLLTGTRGVGKTTIARILAKSLNCVQGVTPEPCGACDACTAIDAGRFVDLLELDAASNTGIDNMREILDNARYAPTAGRYKVYLIDEVHMLSRAAFNSMLKTLEEPPEHVKFVLATTDPQKIPVTVLSRCLQFNLKQLPVATIVERLGAILAAEAIAFEPDGLALVARAAHGSMRDALSLLDQAIAYGAGEVRAGVVRSMLGAVDNEHVYRLLDALIAGDGAALIAEATVIRERSIAAATVLEELASLFHRIAVAQIVPASGDGFPDAARIAQYASLLDAEQVQLGYQICVQGRADLVLAPDDAMGLGMTLLRLLAFSPAVEGTTGTAPGGPAAPVPGRALASTEGSRAGHAGSRQAASPPPTRAMPPSVPSHSPAPVAAATAPIPAHPVAPMEAAALPETPQAWIALVSQLGLAGMAGQLAAQSEWRRSSGREITLAIPETQRHLADRSYVDKLRQAVEGVLGRPLRVAIEVTSEPAASLAAQERRERAEQKELAETTFRNEPFVRDVLARFDARLKPDSVRPALQATDTPRSSH